MKKRTKNPTPLFYEELRELQDQKVEIRFKNTKYDLSKAIFYGKLEKITLYLFEIKNKHIYFVFDKNNIVSIEKNVITLKSLEDGEKITTQSSNPQLFENLLKILDKYVHIRINKDFYKHQGISERGLIRAFLNILLRRGIQGGSTITQQLIKNVLLTPKQTASRKIQEMILAIEVERRYTKDQILQMYLNEAPYGGSLWGVGSAAKGYFNKSVLELWHELQGNRIYSLNTAQKTTYQSIQKTQTYTPATNNKEILLCHHVQGAPAFKEKLARPAKA
jgi:membrane peptidoglycan carboxypeptidase